MDLQYSEGELAVVRPWRIEGLLWGDRKAQFVHDGTFGGAIEHAKAWNPGTAVNIVRIIDPIDDDHGSEHWSEQRDVQLAA